MSTGVLINARAGAARSDPGFVERVTALLPPGHVRATWSHEEIGPALDAFRKLELDVLALVGGDGTVGGTLTQLLERWPAQTRPAVALVPGGTVNTIAKALGGGAEPEAYLRRLLSTGAREESRRPLVRVRGEDGEVRSGMILALGAAVRWLEMYYGDSAMGVRGAASVVGRVLASMSVGGELARRVFAPVPVSVEVDDTRLDLERFTLLGASSVRDVGLGFRPFHSAGNQPDRFHFLASDAGAARLALELPAFRLGLDPPRSCLQHYSARRVSLGFPEPQPWSIDADLHAPSRTLEVEASEPLRFVLLP